MKLSIALALCLTLTGCSPANASAVDTPAPGKPTPAIPVKDDMANIQFGDDFYQNKGLAIAPIPVVINITHVHLGANFQWYAYLHNGDGVKVKELIVQTEPGETAAPIPLKVTLADNKLSDIVGVVSTIQNEALSVAEFYPANNTALITGFTPDTRRIMRVFYKSPSSYEMTYYITSKPKAGYEFMPEGFSEYISFDKKIVTLKPLETTLITIKATIPPNTPFPSKNLEFGIAAHETSTSSATMQTTVGICQQVLVNLN